MPHKFYVRRLTPACKGRVRSEGHHYPALIFFLLSQLAILRFFAESKMMMDSHSIFRPGLSAGDNCWRAEKASHAGMVLDCANYYRALHEAIVRAKHSIFLLGWDIDSRIALLRGKEAEKSEYPPTFFELIQTKARENPNLQIYLNRWNYAFYLASQREGFSKRKWANSPPNVHYVLDDALPLGACHHQKIMVVDDEIAFSGGMDIALGRWDRREHYPKNKNRVDPAGTCHIASCKKFGPYHDIQFLVAGPVVCSLSELVRNRWKQASGDEAIPIREAEMIKLPESWPPSIAVNFRGVNVGIALNIPEMKGTLRQAHIEQLYLDQIERAENFIYIENQFLTHEKIAVALNKRLHACPNLRALLVSCYNPEGIMERKSMWHGRVLFKDILEEGVKDRIALVYPISQVNGDEKPVRIHSKLMIVDNRYLRVGSANLNNRSMSLDTECDLVVEAQTKQDQETIAAIRNDLIREHTGYELKDIERVIEQGETVQTFLTDVTHSRQHLRRVNDEKYRDEILTGLAQRIADPKKPFIQKHSAFPTRPAEKGRRWAKILLVLFAIAACALVWRFTPLADYTSPDKLVPILEQVRGMPWAIPLGIGIYTIATLLFFPHMAMTAVIVMVFSPLQAFTIAMLGSVISGTAGFLIGRIFGIRSLQSLAGEAAEKISHYVVKGGITGVIVIRVLPLAPYMVVNIAFGMTKVTLSVFLIGTFLALLPGTTIASFLGYSLLELWQQPSAESIAYVVTGLLLWVGTIVFSHKIAQRHHHQYG